MIKIDKIYGGNDSMDTVAKLSVYTREKGQLCEWDTGVYYDVVGIAGWLLYSIEAFVMVCYNHKDRILEADLLCLIDIFKGKQWQ